MSRHNKITATAQLIQLVWASNCKAQVPAGIKAQSSSLHATCRTYHTLISPGKGKSRLEQVIEWVGGPDFDGAIVFDEAHKV